MNKLMKVNNLKPVNILYKSLTTHSDVHLTKGQRYIVKFFGKIKYKSINDVPDTMPSQQWVYTKDHARARIMIYGILFTGVGALATVLKAKYDNKYHDAAHKRIESRMKEIEGFQNALKNKQKSE